MQLYVSEKSQLKHIQEGFNAIYPNLKLDFFLILVDRDGHATKRDVDIETFLNNFSALTGVQKIDISASRQISDLEHDLRRRFNLDVRILRKSQNVWVGTIFTGHWTLEKQNFQGGQISTV